AVLIRFVLPLFVCRAFPTRRSSDLSGGGGSAPPRCPSLRGHQAILRSESSPTRRQSPWAPRRFPEESCSTSGRAPPVRSASRGRAVGPCRPAPRLSRRSGPSAEGGQGRARRPPRPLPCLSSTILPEGLSYGASHRPRRPRHPLTAPATSPAFSWRWPRTSTMSVPAITITV